MSMNRFAVKDVPPNYFFSKTVYLDDEFVVAAPEMPFTPELIQTLSEWNFQEVLSDGEPSSSYSDGSENGENADIPVIDLTRASALADAEKIKGAEDFCRDLKAYVDKLFSAVFMGEAVSYKRVAEWMRDGLDRIREDQRYLLRVLKNVESTKEDYLISHTVKTTIIAIIMGFYVKLPPHRLIELGVAAIFHEIGMLKLPAKVYLSPRSLSPEEHKLIYTHPILGYNTLKGYDFPLAVSIAALEHHERENGSGYPRRLTADKISLYSKIVAVACSYDAISSDRPHREARDSYTGMLELLKNEGKQYDDTIIRALVFPFRFTPSASTSCSPAGRRGR
jgi:HD-GYP domain-containing protein (c-di-GMP phosphodiesterase class II)